MSQVSDQSEVLDSGTLSFTIESRILRELGERLVKQPEVALLELVKNAYDADARICEILHQAPEHIVVTDDGHGMTLSEFKGGWMRIGTSAKEADARSRRYNRVITGEKGIGRFAVRFLGRTLHLETIAFDVARGSRTLLTADFDWPVFDQSEDLGTVRVPYRLVSARGKATQGTTLTIGRLRPSAETINLDRIRTASIGVVTPYQSLLKPAERVRPRSKRDGAEADPGFLLRIKPTGGEDDEGDVARAVLDSFVLRAVVHLEGDRLRLDVYRKAEQKPSIAIADKYPSAIGSLYADIRFYPQRKGTFVGLPVDGRLAKTWVKTHSGVAVFDRTFRVHPYGLESDDWLFLSTDTAKRERDPRSSIALKHFPMDEPTRKSTQLNYMLRLPYPQQLVGIVQVEGRRTRDAVSENEGLIAAADREGFVDNDTYQRLRDVVRGAVEAIASADRELQQEQQKAEQEELLRSLQKETRDAVREIESNPDIPRSEKVRIVRHLAKAQAFAVGHQKASKEREAALEIMSLLGVVAGFMTHEFGTALDDLIRAQNKLSKAARHNAEFGIAAARIAEHIDKLRDYVTYTRGYVQGAASRPAKPYSARPRVQQVLRVFGKYAHDRGIGVDVEIEGDLMAPLVPVALYNGVALNLFTNALKAVTAKSGDRHLKIAFRAWNEHDVHTLEVSDTGIGIPVALRQRVFDPLFTTTASNKDPLGSGMGLGLSLVKRGVEGYGGRVSIVDPPPGFTTCVRVRWPLAEKS